MDPTGAHDALTVLLPPFRKGLTSILVCASISLFASSSLLILLAYKRFKDYRASRRPGSWSPGTRGTSIQTQGYFWLVNLFIADFIQSLGLVLVGDHLRLNSVLPGSVCTLQGFLINAGDIASAIWSFVIAAHMFFLLAGGRRWGAWVAEKSMSGKFRWALCVCIWLFVLFLSTIGIWLIEKIHPERGPFYNNAGAGWCWIDQAYFWERIFFHYIFLFINMFALTILYCVLFFYIRTQSRRFQKATSTIESPPSPEISNWEANLEAGPSEKPAPPKQIITTKTVCVTTEERPVQRRAIKPEPDRAHQRMNQIALTLLFYPIMYICLTMPLVLTRVSEFAGSEWGLTSIYVGASLYCCSGFVNVLLYTATRKGIISWDWVFRRRRSISSEAPSPPPPYNPHYPGSYHIRSDSDSTLHLPLTSSSKHSMLSIASLNCPPRAVVSESGNSSMSRNDSSSDFNFEFPVSELNFLKAGTYS